jgi:hypothetical protein
VLCCAVLCCAVLRCAVLCYACAIVLRCAVLCLCYAVLCCAVLCCAVLCFMFVLREKGSLTEIFIRASAPMETRYSEFFCDPRRFFPHSLFFSFLLRYTRPSQGHSPRRFVACLSCLLCSLECSAPWLLCLEIYWSVLLHAR